MISSNTYMYCISDSTNHKRIVYSVQIPNLLNYTMTLLIIMAFENEYPEKYAWWINELNSSGVNTDSKNQESRDVQGLENLADDVNFSIDYAYFHS